MSVQQAHYPHAIAFATGDPLYQLDNVRPAYNDTELNEMCAGGYGPEYLGESFSSPNITFETPQISNILARCTTKNICVDLTAGGVALQYVAGQNMGFREPAGVAEDHHVTGTLTNSSFLYWTSYNAVQGTNPVTISCNLDTVWDESANDPLIFAKGTSIIDACDVTELYGMGKTAINGVVLNGVTSVNWQNNITLETIAADGVEFDTYRGIREVRPVVTLMSTDLNLLADYGQRGIPLDGTNGLVTYLRRHNEATMYDTNAATTHIRLTALEGKVKCQQVSDSPAMVEITIRLKKQTTADFFSVAVGVPIT